MADQSSFNIPWAGLAVVAALVSGSLLAPKAFDQLRPPEKERAQSLSEIQLEVDARLWEDPFFAVRRHLNERRELCGKVWVKDSGTLRDCGGNVWPVNRDPEKFLQAQMSANHEGNFVDNLVILALVSGSPFVGAEEARRRTRYALLAGLQSRGYLPGDTERIGLLEFDGLHPAGSSGTPSSGTPSKPTLVPYELLSPRPVVRGDSPRNGSQYVRIALLWIDEGALPVPRFDALARMVHSLLGKPSSQPDTLSTKLPKLVVVGPSSSDALRDALSNLSRASKAKLADAEARDPFGGRFSSVSVSAARRIDESIDPAARKGYKYLSKAEFLNAAATAPDNHISELDGQELEKFLTDKFTAITRETQPQETQPLKVKYGRMLATDNAVLRSLIKELLRRVPDGQQHRVVLVVERDSLYAHALVSELKHQIGRDKSKRDKLDLSADDVNYYFRGLDGVTTRDSESRAEEPRERSASTARSVQTIEWPETRNQLDYLRRMATAIKQSEGLGAQGPISAIGIFGSDVHDKLLVLQALHHTFPDKVFFTTDMDSRYLHPRTVGFTRNLIVASSLPLEISRRTVAGPAATNGAPAEDSEISGLQAGTPPFRDMYQTATYLAARRAACRDATCES